MDAVKFLREFGRMCRHYSCKDCPVFETPFCFGDCKNLSQEKQERMVEIVENWSRKNPDIIGKKYIIEIDKVEFDSSCEKTMLRIKNVKYDGVGEVWLDKEFIEQLTESKE